MEREEEEIVITPSEMLREDQIRDGEVEERELEEELTDAED